MNVVESPALIEPSATVRLPQQNGLYFDGGWQKPLSGSYISSVSPGTGNVLMDVAQASVDDVELALAAAQAGYKIWRDVPPLERGKVLREIASIVRRHAAELALLDAADSGNPVSSMSYDAEASAQQLEFFAGLVTEMKGASVPMGRDIMNFSIREPIGIVSRIIAFNHPFMFCAGKSAAPLAAGNVVVVKPSTQAPLSALRFVELIDGLLPPGVFSVLPGGNDVGQALASHQAVAKVSVIGSIATGRAVLAAGAETIKTATLELGGKNALVACPDADPREVAAAAVAGMNFAWCGQSCGSTSRAFIHVDMYDQVVELIADAAKSFVPGIPTDPRTTMGAIVSSQQLARIETYIEAGKSEGAKLVTGGKRPNDPALAGGYFLEPTVFADVTPEMRIAREEIFGPVLSVFRWSSEDEMVSAVNALDYGLTASIWTGDLHRAHRLAAKVEAGFVWVNEVSKHFLGAPFGGYKQSGIGREECLSELLSYTREKNIHIRYKSR